MFFSSALKVSTALLAIASSVCALPSKAKVVTVKKRDDVIAPKVLLISMFAPEDVWTKNLNLTTNITIVGASPLFPNVTCNANSTICHMTTGEGEINAAASVMATLLAPSFDWSTTYFLIGGIGGVNPHMGTLGTAAFARYTVQCAQAYEIDPRQLPQNDNWTTGYFLYGTNHSGLPATEYYGTEVFEYNTNLLNKVLNLTANVNLTDGANAKAFRARYDYAPANLPPTVIQGDSVTSDVYFAGSILGEAFGNITKLFTNGTGNYVTTAQEDSATSESLLRLAKAGLVDFSRVVLLRTASDFDRAPPNMTELASFTFSQGGGTIAFRNIYVALLPVVEDILANWDTIYEAGIAPQDGFLETADDFHTLATRSMEKRSMSSRAMRAGVKSRGFKGPAVTLD